MMKFKIIKDTKNKEFEELWKIYEYSFPADERRNLEQQSELLKNKKYRFQAIYDNSDLIGFIAIWNFSQFNFIEHFAVKEELRNKGLGRKLIEEYKKRSDKFLVLETERPEAGDMAKRRISFWGRNKFILNIYDYIQPSYGLGKSPVPLFLMTYPKHIDIKLFRIFRDLIHKKVYKSHPIKGKDN